MISSYWHTRCPVARLLVASLIVVFALSTSRAPAATLKEHGAVQAFLAIYGTPAFGAATPIGGGLARNFGFGSNLAFEGCTICELGKNLAIEVGGVKIESQHWVMAASLSSNKTGANNPLAIAVQSVDAQNATAGGLASPLYADTSTRPWLTTVCPPPSATCRTDPRFIGPAGGAKIEGVSLDAGGTVLQGALWGKWENSVEAGKPACLKLEMPPVGAPETLVVSQGAGIGERVTAVAGQGCLVSANNEVYPGKEPFIEVANE
jgi:hypothetical protein